MNRIKNFEILLNGILRDINERDKIFIQAKNTLFETKMIGEELMRLTKLTQHLGACEDCHCEHEARIDCRDIEINELKNQLKQHESLYHGILEPLEKEGYPDNNRDTQNGICPCCKSEVVNITPRYRKLTGCCTCGTVIDWR